ncbi:hypothetical protein DFH28DRAFT_1087320 [Melampsora americana]|nr:hypothetical protein DFH28DRAFT_1087320 [Melampsora americana]
MAPIWARGDLLNPQASLNHSSCASQGPSVGISLKGLNNHEELKTPQVLVPGSEGRRRPKVKALITGIAKATANSNSSPSPLPREILKPRGEPGDNFQLLTQSEHAFIDGITTSSGLDNKHVEYAQEMGEVNVFGDKFRHLAVCGNFTWTQFLLTAVADHVSSLAGEMGQAMENINQDIANKISILTAKVNDLSDALLTQNTSQGTLSTAATYAAAQVARTATVLEWKESQQLKALLSKLSVQLISEANLQSYTELEDRSKNYLQRLLFNCVKVSACCGSKPSRISLHLPKQIQGVDDGEGLKKYTTAIKDASKHAREKLHLLLLINVHNQKEGPVKVVPVPSLMELWHRIALKCGLISESVDQVTASRSADEATQGRIAYLRRKATRLRQTPSGTNIWAEVDQQLDALCEKDKEVPEYTTFFYNIIYQNDQERFNGKRGWSEIKESYVLALPTEEAILVVTSGKGVKGPKALGNEGEYKVLGNQRESLV